MRRLPSRHARKHRLELLKIYATNPIFVVDVEAETQRLVVAPPEGRHALQELVVVHLAQKAQRWHKTTVERAPKRRGSRRKTTKKGTHACLRHLRQVDVVTRSAIIFLLAHRTLYIRYHTCPVSLFPVEPVNICERTVPYSGKKQSRARSNTTESRSASRREIHATRKTYACTVTSQSG